MILDHAARSHLGVQAGIDVDGAELVETYRRLLARRTELTPAQAAVMQAVDDARRIGEINDEQATEIEHVIRRGQVAGARKRLTRARRGSPQ